MLGGKKRRSFSGVTSLVVFTSKVDLSVCFAPLIIQLIFLMIICLSVNGISSIYILLSILSIQKPNAMENPLRFSPQISSLRNFTPRKILGQNIYPFCNAFLKHSFPFPEIGICEVPPEGICVLAGILR